MRIFIDLDDMLVAWTSPFQTIPDIIRVEVTRGRPYTFKVRPTSEELVKRLARIAPITLMTGATSQMANAIAAKCAFSKFLSGCIAREDYLGVEYQSQGKPRYVATKKGICPAGVLIDHQLQTDEQVIIKMEALGISPSRFIRLPSYDPNRNDPLGEGMIRETERAVRAILATEPKCSP
jgi:hypothetical protein